MSKALCFTCTINRKTCSILKIPGITYEQLTTCPDYRRAGAAKPAPQTKEKAIQAKLF